MEHEHPLAFKPNAAFLRIEAKPRREAADIHSKRGGVVHFFPPLMLSSHKLRVRSLQTQSIEV